MLILLFLERIDEKMFKLQITYYNSFTKQNNVETFSQVEMLMIRVQHLMNNKDIQLLDFHSNKKDRWFIAIKYK